jgi:hypothetical protein
MWFKAVSYQLSAVSRDDWELACYWSALSEKRRPQAA